MKIALVHDDLVQWGGAERMLLALAELFTDAPIYTSVFDRDNLLLSEKFKGKKIVTSFLQKIPGWKWFYRAFLPLYPLAFEQFDFSEFDIVISQTTKFAKCIITKPGTKHICYCHTPPRFLWGFSGEKTSPFISPLLGYLRTYDRLSSKRVDVWLAGSLNAKERINKVYKSDSRIIYPFVDTDRFKNIETFDGGYLLVISRLNDYKKIDLAIKACIRLSLPLKIIGTGPSLGKLRKIAEDSEYIDFLGSLSDELVVRVLAGAKALIFPGTEDFGIVPLEALSLGKPVIALREGGALETIDKRTGIFFENQTVESLEACLKKLDSMKFKKEDFINRVNKFTKHKFETDFCQALTIN